MIIDFHTHIYAEEEPAWSFAVCTAETLIESMDVQHMQKDDGPIHVAKSVVQPTPGVTIIPHLDFRQQHQYVIDSVKAHPDRLIGAMMFNPHKGVAAGCDEMRYLVKEHGFKMVKLHPNFHTYFPNKAKNLSYPILEEVQKLGITLMIHTGDTPFSLPSLMAPLARDFPKVPILLGHMGVQKLALSDDAINVGMQYDNVFLEMSWGPLNRVKEAVEFLGTDKLVFGTDSPFNDVGVHARIIDVLGQPPPWGMNLSRTDRDKILYKNAEHLLGITLK